MVTVTIGDEVKIFWPGSNTGGDSKLAKVVSITKGGRIGVVVAQTTPKGEYTCSWGRSTRWIDAEEVLSVEEKGAAFGLQGEFDL